MLSILLQLAILAKGGLSANIAFWDHPHCSGTALFGTQNLTSVPCHSIADFQAAGSVTIAQVKNGETVRLYKDGDCSAALYGTTSDTCYSSDLIQSFSVQKVDASDKAVEPYKIKLTNYTGLAVTPDAKLLSFLRPTLAFGVRTGAGLLSFSAAVVSCTTVNGSATSIFLCVAVPIATILGYVADYLFHRHAADLPDAALGLSTGQFNNVKRSLDGMNEDYLTYLANITKSPMEKVGFMKRTMSTGDHLSPIYEFTPQGGDKWHLSAFFDNENGDFIHHIEPAPAPAATEMSDPSKRSAPIKYDGIRWGNGGMEFRVCSYGGNAASFPSTSSGAYNSFYDQLTCAVSSAALRGASGLQVDILNEAGTVVGEAEIIPYQPSQVMNPPTCQATTAPINTNCAGLS